jgi:hypothetical protein
MRPLLRGQARTDRVLRGGSFNNNASNARGAVRNHNNPNNFNDNIGLRVVVAHIFRVHAGNAGRVRLPGRGKKNGGACPWPSSGLLVRAGQIATAPPPWPARQARGGAQFRPEDWRDV